MKLAASVLIQRRKSQQAVITTFTKAVYMIGVLNKLNAHIAELNRFFRSDLFAAGVVKLILKLEGLKLKFGHLLSDIVQNVHIFEYIIMIL